MMIRMYSGLSAEDKVGGGVICFCALEEAQPAPDS